MLRKDRVFDALRSLCAQPPAPHTVWRRHMGFSAEEVAELAQIDRTNASRDLNQLVTEGLVERIPGRPVLFVVKALAAVPANATSLTIGVGNGPQYYGHGPSHGPSHQWQMRRLSPEQVRWRLERQGYHAIRFFDTRGPVYRVSARHHGHRYVLSVSARSGQIIGRHRG